MQEALGVDDALAEETSLGYLGRWNQLVSTTNWEKGRIILEWRDALRAAGAAASQYSNDAWGRRVGNVTGQHVGRLRRVYERFGDVRQSYAGLYWSHFQAALDWDDAEMWLEGAVQSQWSVSRMRTERWQAHGAPADQKPRDEDVYAGPLDEDFSDPDRDRHEVRNPDGTAPRDFVDDEGPDFGVESSSDEVGTMAAEGVPFDIDSDDVTGVAMPASRPFAALPEMPDDLAEAFDAFKLAILRYKVDEWRDVSRDDVLATLDALRAMVLAPS